MFNRILTYGLTAAASVSATAAVVLAAAGPAYASPVLDGPVLAANSLPVVIGNITNWIIGLLVAVATLFLTIGGLRRLAAGGDPAEIEKANSAFKNALFGYALAILAPILLGIVRGWVGG